jgi:hypothetical protein
MAKVMAFSRHSPGDTLKNHTIPQSGHVSVLIMMKMIQFYHRSLGFYALNILWSSVWQQCDDELDDSGSIPGMDNEGIFLFATAAT